MLAPPKHLSTINVYDGNTLLGTANTNAAGAWTFTTTALSNGTHTFTANAIDSANNLSVVSNALAVIVDPNAPNPVNHAPDVTAPNAILARGQDVAISSLISATDADGDAIVSYQFWDGSPSAQSGHFTLNGVTQAAQTLVNVSAGSAVADDVYFGNGCRLRSRSGRLTAPPGVAGRRSTSRRRTMRQLLLHPTLWRRATNLLRSRR